uniref:Cystatin domain-containing protein n=1 Tax=Solanum tuberosum TaxID=4113 RepID=M0ZJW9_SOLTU
MGENRQQPRGGSTEGSRKKTTEEEFFKFIKQGNGYLCGRKRGPVNIRDSDVDLPNGALPEHRYQFKEIWECYFNQLNSTNGMDLDTFPGDAEVANTLPSNLNALKEEDKEYQLITDLAHLAIDECNKESILYKYKFLKIEKLNLRLTGYMEYFMTVKVKNLTLATVYETFQIHAGAHPADFAKRIFSCLPKGGALPLPLPSLEEVSVDTVPSKST